MNGTIERLIAEAVRAAVRESVTEMQAAIEAAVREAAKQGSPAGAPYVTVKEAAAIMSAHPATVRRLVADGKLARYSVEGQLRVKLADLHAYLAREGRAEQLDIEGRALEILGSSDRTR
jgi:excisionase family DNA binding protein